MNKAVKTTLHAIGIVIGITAFFITYLMVVYVLLIPLLDKWQKQFTNYIGG